MKKQCYQFCNAYISLSHEAHYCCDEKGHDDNHVCFCKQTWSNRKRTK